MCTLGSKNWQRVFDHTTVEVLPFSGETDLEYNWQEHFLPHLAVLSFISFEIAKLFTLHSVNKAVHWIL